MRPAIAFDRQTDFLLPLVRKGLGYSKLPGVDPSTVSAKTLRRLCVLASDADTILRLESPTLLAKSPSDTPLRKRASKEPSDPFCPPRTSYLPRCRLVCCFSIPLVGRNFPLVWSSVPVPLPLTAVFGFRRNYGISLLFRYRHHSRFVTFTAVNPNNLQPPTISYPTKAACSSILRFPTFPTILLANRSSIDFIKMLSSARIFVPSLVQLLSRKSFLRLCIIA